MDRFLFGLPLPWFYKVVFGIVVLQNGLWAVPDIKTRCNLASDITRQLTRDNPHVDYLYTSFLGLALAFWTNAWKSPVTFAALHLVCLGLGMAVLLRVVQRKFGDPAARILTLSFATVPVSNVLLTWLGMSDVFVFVFATGIVLAEGAATIAGLAFLLGISHLEQGGVIAAGLAFCRMYQVGRSGKSWRAAVAPVAAMAAGIAGAHAAVYGYFAFRGFHLANTRFSFLKENHWGQFLLADYRHFETLMFSLHGCYWLVVAGLTASLWHSRRRLALGVIGFQVALLSLTLITLDETRIFCLLAWPFLVFLLRPDIVPTRQLRGYVVAAYACGLIVPKLIIWDGHIHAGTLFYGIDLLTRFVTGDPTIDGTDPISPFR